MSGTIDMVRVTCPKCQRVVHPACDICSGHGAIYMAKGVINLTTIDDDALEKLKQIISEKIEAKDFTERKPRK